MSIYERDIVADLHEALREEIGADRFDLWIRDQVVFRLEQQHVTAYGRDSFALDQVRRSFGQVIGNLVERLGDQALRLRWQATTDLLKSSSPTVDVLQNAERMPLGSTSGTAENRGQEAPSLNHRSASHQAAATPSSETPGLDCPRQATPLHKERLRAVESNSVRRSTVGGENLTGAAKSGNSSTLPFQNPAVPSSIDAARRSSKRPANPSHKSPQVLNSLPSPSTEPPRKKACRGSFQDFIVCDQSKFGYSAAGHVPDHLGEVTPLYLHGPNGVGKTHLLQAIYDTVRFRRQARSLLITSEQFTTGFLEALRGHGLPNFRRKYRQIDLLLIDDVQFFLGKKATLVELYHTIDALLQGGKQVVLSADRPPHELSGIGNEIVTRLSAGLICALDYPTGHSRLELVQSLASRNGQVLPLEVAELLASELQGDARQLQGALNRLAVVQLAMNQPLTTGSVRRELNDLFQASTRPLEIRDIERAVCDMFGVDGSSLRSERKAQTISQPRMLAMWLARKHTRAAYSEIGEYFGGRSHSTVISAANKVEKWVGEETDIRIACGQSNIKETIRPNRNHAPSRLNTRPISHTAPSTLHQAPTHSPPTGACRQKNLGKSSRCTGDSE